MSFNLDADKVFVFETSSAPYEVEAGKKIKWCPCGRAEGGVRYFLFIIFYRLYATENTKLTQTLSQFLLYSPKIKLSAFVVVK